MYVPEKMAPGQLDPRRRTPGTGCTGDRIQVVDKNGRHLAFWPDYSRALAIRGERIYVGEVDHIAILDAATGKELESIVPADGGHGLAVDSQGDVYVASHRPGKPPLSRYSRRAR